MVDQVKDSTFHNFIHGVDALDRNRWRESLPLDPDTDYDPHTRGTGQREMSIIQSTLKDVGDWHCKILNKFCIGHFI